MHRRRGVCPEQCREPVNQLGFATKKSFLVFILGALINNPSAWIHVMIPLGSGSRQKSIFWLIINFVFPDPGLEIRNSIFLILAHIKNLIWILSDKITFLIFYLPQYLIDSIVKKKSEYFFDILAKVYRF